MSNHTHLKKRLEKTIAVALYDSDHSQLSSPEKADVDRFVKLYIMPTLSDYIERNYQRIETTVEQ